MNKISRNILTFSCLFLLALSCKNMKSEENKKKSLLLGIWWDADEKDATCASFDIKDTTIYYPDQEGKSEYSYQIKKDSFIVNYDGYISTSIIVKVTKDTLVLITDGEKQTFIKTE